MNKLPVVVLFAMACLVLAVTGDNELFLINLWLGQISTTKP